MKIRSFIAALLIMAAAIPAAFAATPEKFVPGKDLTLIGKLMPTPERYSRVDTVKYTGYTEYQRRLNVETAGLALVFNTNSDRVLVNMDYNQNKGKHHAYNGTDIASAGCDLYILRDGAWVYAGSGVPNDKGKPASLVAHMAPGEKQCLLYLPLRSVIDEIYVGVDSAATIEAAPNPFTHKVVFWGSSYTHGVSANRSGMAYPLQFQRATGLNICALGVSGNSKLQQSYARLLADTEADAFVFDAFSNPSAKEIRANFDAFLKTIREKHPTTPIIFQQTIYRGGRNFDTKADKTEAAKMAAAEEVVRNAMKTDPNVYFIYPSPDTDGSTCTDKIHPSDLGYYNWMQSIRQPILDILAKYGIK